MFFEVLDQDDLAIGKSNLAPADTVFETEVEREFLDQSFDPVKLDRNSKGKVFEPGSEVTSRSNRLEGGIILGRVGIVIFFESEEFFDLVTLEVEKKEGHSPSSATIAIGKRMDPSQLVVEDPGA